MKTLLTIILTLSFIGCKKYQCQSFDKEHPINKWNWFPNNLDTYHFANSNFDTLSLVKIKYEMTPSREFQCHMCACLQDLTAYYDIVNLNIQFRCTLGYGEGSDDTKSEGSMYYGIDKIGSPFSSNGQSVLEEEIPQYESKEFDITYADTLKLANIEFYNVTELKTLDTTKSKIHRIWMAPNKGMIGFELYKQEWVKK